MMPIASKQLDLARQVVDAGGNQFDVSVAAMMYRFQEREVENYRQQWPDIMEKTRSKLETYRQHIGNIEYQAKDGFKVLEEELNPAHTVIAAPPI